MVRAEPRALVRCLTESTTRMLEGAVSRAVSARNREVGVEHLLASMIETDDGDCGLLLRHVNRSRERLVAQVETVLTIAGLV